MTRVRHSELSTLSSAAVVDAMRNAGYGTTDVLVRFIDRDPETLKRALATGTDRTDKSNLFTQGDAYCRGSDASPAARAASGITAHRVTYAFRLNLAEATPMIRWGGHTAGFPEMAHPLQAMLEGLSATGAAVLVYSPTSLKRAPDAEAEYWFDREPKEALLHVLSGPAPSPR